MFLEREFQRVARPEQARFRGSLCRNLWLQSVVARLVLVRHTLHRGQAWWQVNRLPSRRGRVIRQWFPGVALGRRQRGWQREQATARAVLRFLTSLHPCVALMHQWRCGHLRP